MKKFQEMFCHNPECEAFNQYQEFGYYEATYYDPSEWADDPECRDCGSPCEDHRIDTEFHVNNLLDGISDEGEGFHGKDKFDRIFQFAIEWAKENIDVGA